LTVPGKRFSSSSPLLYVEDDKPDKSDDLRATLKSLDYVLYEHRAPLFNPENFYKEKENSFLLPKDGGYIQYVSINLFCHHKGIRSPIDTESFGMRRIL